MITVAIVILCAVYILFGFYMASTILLVEEGYNLPMRIFIILSCVTLGPILMLLGLFWVALVSFLQFFEIFRSKY